MDPNLDTGRYSSRSNPFPPGSACLSGRSAQLTGRGPKPTIHASKKMSVANNPVIIDVRIDEMVVTQQFERKNCLDDLIGPFRYRLDLEKDTFEKWHPVAVKRPHDKTNYAMVQRREPLTTQEIEMDFSCFHPVWHLYTKLKESHIEHLPHNYVTHHKVWNPVCTGYAMIYEFKGPYNYEKIHPTFGGYRLDHWIELQPDPFVQTNPAALITLTHCPNAPNINENSRFVWDAAIISPIYLG